MKKSRSLNLILRNARRGVASCAAAVLVLAPFVALAAADLPQPDPASSTTLDITIASGPLAAVSPSSTPAQIAAAIQTRFDYLHRNRLPGRVVLPAGEWRIDRPIFVNGDHKELVGAGAGQTVLQAADGFHAMSLLNVGCRSSFDERPLQACNRVRLTDPAQRVLDASVAGERFGLRTYAEFPADHFPAVSHLATSAREAKNWAAGIAYRAGDVALMPAPASPRPVELICLASHTASLADQPFQGRDWKTLWVAKIPAQVQFFADPLTAGALDPATGRATNWHGMERFTLDFAFVQNAEAKLFEGSRMLCGVVMSDITRPEGYVWMITNQSDGRLMLNVVLDDGKAHSIELAKNCGAVGLYRLALQLDLRRHAVEAWIRRPGDPAMSRTCDNTTAIPAGARIQELEYGYFTITGGDNGSPSGANGSLIPPIDLTVCGLHMAAALRYDSAEALLDRQRHQTVDDRFRYFANDASTIAFLPLMDHPSDDELATTGMLVTVEHGPAAGDAGQRSFGYFKVPSQIYGVGRPRVSGMTLRVGPIWGVGIVAWHTLDAQFNDLDIRGGFYAIGDLFYGAQYTFDIHDCRLSGSEAALNGSSAIMLLKHVVIDPVGRYGILMSGSNMTLDDVQFGDPERYQSQYYVRHLSSVLYGGMNLFTNVHADAPASSRYPSRAAISQQNIWIFRTALVVRDCSVSNLGPNAALLDLPYGAGPCSARLFMERCRYRGSPIAAWVRSDSPWWTGEIVDCEGLKEARRLVDYSLPPGPNWKAGAKYGNQTVVREGQSAWVSLQEHTSEPADRPGTDGARSKAYWKEAIPRIDFVPREAKGRGDAVTTRAATTHSAP